MARIFEAGYGVVAEDLVNYAVNMAHVEDVGEKRELVIYTGLYVHSDGTIHDKEEKD